MAKRETETAAATQHSALFAGLPPFTSTRFATEARTLDLPRGSRLYIPNAMGGGAGSSEKVATAR